MKVLLLVTTSHRPSPRTRSFIKDLVNTLPYAVKVNRGKKTLSDIGLEARKYNANYVFIVCEKKGNPSLIKVYRVNKYVPYPLLSETAILKIAGVKLSRENPESSRAYNPETLYIDYDKCISVNCYQVSDIFTSIYRGFLNPDKPDIKIVLEEVNSVIYFKPVNRLNRICGPLIKISGVKILV